jgi:hypothetical protein
MLATNKTMTTIISVCQFMQQESRLRHEMEFPSRPVIDAKAPSNIGTWEQNVSIDAVFSDN